MKKIISILAVAMLLLCSASASAQIVLSGSGNTEIGAFGFSNVNTFDANGDGKTDLLTQLFGRARDVVGAPDAKGISRNTHSESDVFGLIDPLTGRVILKSKGLTHILRYDAPSTAAGFIFINGNGGIFTSGAARYLVDIQSVDTGFQVPFIKGTKYIDAAMSVVIINVKTGAFVKRFVLQSNPTWYLNIRETRFADVNGVTRFIEHWDRRPVTLPVPVPGKPSVDKVQTLVKIWDATHTKLIKQFFTSRTFVTVP